MLLTPVTYLFIMFMASITYVFMCVGVQVCVQTRCHVCRCASMCVDKMSCVQVCECVHSQDVNIRHCSQSLSSFLGDRISSLSRNQESYKIDWPRISRDSPVFTFPLHLQACTLYLVFMWLLGIELSTLYLHGKHFNSQATFLAPSASVFCLLSGMCRLSPISQAVLQDSKSGVTHKICQGF